MNFGLAIESLKIGNRVRRTGWNGKGMWLVLCEFTNDNLYFGNEKYSKLPWIGMKTADNCFVPWLASQTDILAEDWEEIFSEPEPIVFTDTAEEIEERMSRYDDVKMTCNNVIERSENLLNPSTLTQIEKDLQHEQTR
jgi:hypothetical protein